MFRANDAGDIDMDLQDCIRAGRHALIVDDDPHVIKALTRLLRHHCDQIWKAQDGATALDILARRQLHVLICDSLAHPMSGIELFRHARKACPKITTIMLTGKSDLSDVQQARRDGLVDAFSLKPWQNDWVVATVCAIDIHTFDMRDHGPPCEHLCVPFG